MDYRSIITKLTFVLVMEDKALKNKRVGTRLNPEEV